MQYYLNYILSYFPRPLPTGMTAHDAWAKRIVSLTGPLADEDSLRWALANQVMHLPATCAYKPDQYFIRALRKAAANQIAGGVFTQIKEAQEARKLKLQQEQTEATNQNAASNDDQKTGA